MNLRLHEAVGPGHLDTRTRPTAVGLPIYFERASGLPDDHLRTSGGIIVGPAVLWKLQHKTDTLFFGTVPQGLGRPEPACNTRGYGVLAAKRAPLGVASWNRKAHEGNRKGMLPLRFASCELVPCFTIQKGPEKTES